jgi:hypothetical protein
MSKEIPIGEWLKDDRLWKVGKDRSMSFEIVIKISDNDQFGKKLPVTNWPPAYFYLKNKVIHWRRIK